MVELLAWWRKLDRTFAGHPAPRFRGTPPVWAGGKRWLGPASTGWAVAPTRAGAVDTAAVDSAVGVAGRP
jgi:hypothetical protein